MVFQKLRRYLNGTAISTSTVPSSAVLFVNFDLHFSHLESAMLCHLYNITKTS